MVTMEAANRRHSTAYRSPTIPHDWHCTVRYDPL